MGFIHGNNTPEEQLLEVQLVKRFKSGFIKTVSDRFNKSRVHKIAIYVYMKFKHNICRFTFF